ncbi:MAG: hypothetical protein IT159_09535 [Bryobacterales bacterium]|nr:hypothetical protein [Bryobacterales bacterium]
MDRLEDALREALRREAPPQGFAERVVARNAVLGKKGTWDVLRGWLAPGPAKWAAAAALAIVLLAGIQHTSELRRRARGEAARDQVLTALRITAVKLEQARAKVEKTVRIEALVPGEAGAQLKPSDSF